MTSETDAAFLDRLEELPRYVPAYRTLDSDRLFDLARRGAAAADRIEQLEAALRDALSYSTIGDMPVTIYENARAALEERT